MTGTVTDFETNEIIPNATVSLIDDLYQPIKEVVTDKNGKYSIPEAECFKTYYVRTSKQDYETKEIIVSMERFTGKTSLPIQLEKRIKPITVGTDLAKTLDIPIIYFDLDKAFIKKESAFQLAKIIETLKQYPEMKLDIRSHTDSRQTFNYNQTLSDKRAKATMRWLVDNGVNAGRLEAKGYGETQLVNKCADGVKCSEEEHQFNRRSEFIITNM